MKRAFLVSIVAGLLAVGPARAFDSAVVAGQMPALTGDCTTTIGTVATTCATKVNRVKVQKFTASGTYTPSTGILYAIIECVGGGGAGGGSKGTTGNYYGAGGGGSGSYSRAYVSAATIGASQIVTIGAAGAVGPAGENNGGTGGDTSVGALCVGKGGVGGSYGSANQVGGGGAGGAAGTGDFSPPGNVGGSGLYNNVNSSIVLPSGNGAASIFGGGVSATHPAPAACAAGTAAPANTGGGGSGAVCNNANTLTASGGLGGSGVVLITEFANQ